MNMSADEETLPPSGPNEAIAPGMGSSFSL